MRTLSCARCRVALASALIFLSGCGLWGDTGILRDRGNDYLKAGSVPPLEVPPGLDSDAIENIYYVPPIDASVRTDAKWGIPRPQPLVAGDFENLVKIQALGQSQWILVRLLPGQVWPRVKDYLVTRRVGVGLEDGDQGIILTPWLGRPQAAFDEIYRFHLVQGLQRNTTEVRVLQAQRRSEAAARDSRRSTRLERGQGWAEVSDDPRRERMLLQQFADYLASTADVNASVSLVAQGISTKQRLYSVAGENPEIRVNLGFDRAWASLALALDKATFEVTSEDRDSASYTVLPPVMADDDSEKGNRFTALFKPSTYRKGKSESTHYRFSLEASERAGWLKIRVRAADAEQKPLSSEQQEALLALVQGYLT